MDYNEVITILEIIKDGYDKMDVNRILEVLHENAAWMTHPWDTARHYVGHEIIKALLKEFENKEELKLVYFDDEIIFDETTGVAHAQWLQLAQDKSPEGRLREKHTSHSVIMKFKDNKIETIKFHSVKTNKYWTTPLISGTQKKKRRNNKKYRRNGNRNGGKNGYHNQRRKTQGRDNNGSNGHSNNNSQSEMQLNHEQNASEQKPIAKEVSKPNGEKHFKSSSRSGSRNGRGRHNGNARGRNGRPYGKANGRRHKAKRGGRGRGCRGKKKMWLPWKCSACEFQNVAEAESCKNCNKEFEFKNDLSEEQKEQCLSQKQKAKFANNSTEETVQHQDLSTEV
jgi:hypothetical protein